MVMNKFAALTDEDQHPMDTESESETSETVPVTVKKYKVPAIIFKATASHGATIRTLDSKVTDKNYLLKTTGDSYKLTLRNPNDYRSVTDFLKIDGTEFHTFATTKTRSQRFIIRGLPRSVDTADIDEELQALGFKPSAVVQLSRHSGDDKIVYPLFAVTLPIEAGTPAKDVSTITRLLRCAVTTEAPRTTRGPAQCHRCQRVGHATAYCYQAPRCVRCAGDHLVANCPTPRGTADPKCCNCTDGDHPASYRGCTYLKRAKQQAAQPKAGQSAGWQKKAESAKPIAKPRLTMRPRLEIPPNITTPGRTYADAIQGNTKGTNQTQTPPPKETDPTDPSWAALLRQILVTVEQSNRHLALLMQTMTAILAATLTPKNAVTP